MIPHASNPDKVWKLEVMYIPNGSINNRQTKILDFDETFAPTLLSNISDKGYTKHCFRKSLEQFVEEQEALSPNDIVISGRMVLVENASVKEMFQKDLEHYQESIEDNNTEALEASDNINDFNNFNNFNSYNDYVDNSYSFGVSSYGNSDNIGNDNIGFNGGNNNNNNNNNNRRPPSRPPPSKSNTSSRSSYTQTPKFIDNMNFQNLYNFNTSNLDNQNNFNQPNSFNQSNNVNTESIYNLISNVDPNSTVDDYEAVSLPEGGPSPFIDGFVYSSY